MNLLAFFIKFIVEKYENLWNRFLKMSKGEFIKENTKLATF